MVKNKNSIFQGRDSKLPKFSSEHLMQQAVAGLLARMPKISEVQILHGAQEYGKDIIFHSQGPLGEPLPCACVVKNKKISGKVTDNSSARAVFYQVEQALDTPFVDGSGQEVRVYRVYVISPEEISQSSMHSIKGKLVGRSGQVTFLGGSELFRMFRKYWPDFFADEYAAIDSHIETLTEEVSRSALRSAAEIYNVGSVSESEAAIYVDRQLFRELKYHTLRDLYHVIYPSWKSTWKKVDVDHFRYRLDELSSLVTHLEAWGFFPDHASAIVRSIENLSGRLLDKWLAAAADEARVRINSELPPNLLITIPGQEGLENELMGILDSVDSSLSSLRSACSAYLRLPSWQSDISILSNSDWRLSSAVDDCARHAPIDLFSSKQGLRVQFSEPEALSYSGLLLIVGAAGYGKTSFCRWHALADAESFRVTGSGILPVYVPLNAISASEITGFEETFLKGVGRSALLNDASLKKANSIRLYLDGLDEVPSEKQRRAIVELAKKGPSSGSLRAQIIITARDYVVNEALAGMPRLELSPLGDLQVDELKSQWFKSSQALHASFEEQIEKVPVLKSLMKVPLLATLILMVFRQTGRLPESRARLYNAFIDLLSGGWDLAKGVLRHTRFGRAPKAMLLAELAANVQIKRLKYFQRQELTLVSQRMMQGDADVHKLLHEELILDGVIAKSGENYFFSHLSFQEFLAAKYFIGDPQSGEINRVLAKFVAGDDWWREVVRFYISLSENPVKIVRWLLKELERAKGEAEAIEGIFLSLGECFPDFDLVSYLRDNAGGHVRRVLEESQSLGLQV